MHADEQQLQDLVADLGACRSRLELFLRIHLWAEAALIQLIRLHLSHPDVLDVETLRFPSKLQLTSALGGLPERCMQPYLKLNNLRNKLAHRLSFRLSDDDIVDLRTSLTDGLECYYNHVAQRATSESDDALADDLRVIGVVLVHGLHEVHAHVAYRQEHWAEQVVAGLLRDLGKDNTDSEEHPVCAECGQRHRHRQGPCPRCGQLHELEL